MRSTVTTEGDGYLAEYNSRMRLRKLGYTFDGSKLDNYTAQCFLILSQELDKISEEKMRRKK